MRMQVQPDGPLKGSWLAVSEKCSDTSGCKTTDRYYTTVLTSNLQRDLLITDRWKPVTSLKPVLIFKGWCKSLSTLCCKIQYICCIFSLVLSTSLSVCVYLSVYWTRGIRITCSSQPTVMWRNVWQRAYWLGVIVEQSALWSSLSWLGDTAE